MSGQAMGNIAVLLVRGNKIDKMMELMMSLVKSPHLITGTISTERINEMFEICLAQAYTPAIFVSTLHSSHQLRRSIRPSED